MKNQTIVLAAVTSSVLLSGCDRLVPSAESMTGKPAIHNVTHGIDGDQLIYVSSGFAAPCTKNNAEVVVSGALKPDDVTAQWASDNGDAVIVSLASGDLERSKPTALNGKVTLEYRKVR